jgi:WavE lipopolysaccharide synthesis
MTEKIDIVIQGPYTDYTDSIIESYLNLPFTNNIIVSCWNDNKLPKERRRVKFIRNNYPFSCGTDNKNLQIVSSLSGLKHCNTNFAIKTRSDQKFTYDSMMGMYEFFLDHNEKTTSYQYNHKKPYNKILVAGVYPNLLFAFRDHIFWGSTDDLIEFFDIPLEQNSLIDKVKIPKERLGNYCNYFTRTETYLGAHYCSNFNEEINRILLLQDQHLYDNSIYWYYSKEISDTILSSVIKSFPRSVIDLDWVKCSSLNFNFNIQEYLDFAAWHEDGY